MCHGSRLTIPSYFLMVHEVTSPPASVPAVPASVPNPSFLSPRWSSNNLASCRLQVAVLGHQGIDFALNLPSNCCDNRHLLASSMTLAASYTSNRAASFSSNVTARPTVSSLQGLAGTITANHPTKIRTTPILTSWACEGLPRFRRLARMINTLLSQINGTAPVRVAAVLGDT
jgi:hypothetical protein